MRGIYNNEDPFAVGVLKFELVTKDACACLLRPGKEVKNERENVGCTLFELLPLLAF